jgi:hypothetical protein
MIGTTLTPKTTLSRLSRKIRRVARQPRPLQVKASDVDSYGDYDVEQLNELPANPAGSNAAPDVSAEEFDTLYHWYLS